MVTMRWMPESPRLLILVVLENCSFLTNLIICYTYNTILAIRSECWLWFYSKNTRKPDSLTGLIHSGQTNDVTANWVVAQFWLQNTNSTLMVRIIPKLRIKKPPTSIPSLFRLRLEPNPIHLNFHPLNPRSSSAHVQCCGSRDTSAEQWSLNSQVTKTSSAPVTGPGHSQWTMTNVRVRLGQKVSHQVHRH